MRPDRPQAPGYLANLMARLFHEVAGQGLIPLGIHPDQFPLLVELWFGTGASRLSLAASQEMQLAECDALVRTLAEDGLIAGVPDSPDRNLVLTDRALALRGAAFAAARAANEAAASALSDAEMVQFLAMMNRVIDALQAAAAAR